MSAKSSWDKSRAHADPETQDAMLRIKQLPTFDSVAAGKKAVVDLPLGLRYHAVWLRVGNAAAIANELVDVVDDIVVKINGKPQRTHTAVELNALNGVNGAAYLEKVTGTSGAATYVHYLPIFFAQPWRKDQAEVPMLALRANGIDSFQIEVNLRATNSAAVANANLFLDGWYEFDYDDRTIGALQKWIRQDYSASGTTRDIATIDKRDFIEAIHLFATSDGKYVTEVKFTANGEELRDRITYQQNRASLLGRSLVPDSNATPRYDLEFDFDDPVAGQLPTSVKDGPLKEMTLKVTWNAAAAGTQTAIIQRTGPIE